MSKDYLKAWNFIKDQMPYFTFSHLVTEMGENSDIVDNALQRLEAIENANPSEAMKCLGNLERYFLNKWKQSYYLEEKPKELNDIITIKQYILKTQEQEKLLNTIFQNIELDENYSEQCGGSTKAYKLVIPNCISVEEDENYTDDSFPNSDFEVIDNFAKERAENE